MNTLILNANDLVGVLNERRQAIVELLAHTSALAKQLSGLIHDNEEKLAPTLDKLNAVTAILEKNRDNIAKAIPGLAKFQTTLGETIGNGPYYQAYVPNLFISADLPAVLRLRVRLPAGNQCRSATRQCRSSRGASLPVQRDSRSPASSGGRHRHDSKPAPETRRLRRCSRWRSSAASPWSFSRPFFKPNTITAYFTKTVAIYPGDEVRIAGVKVGTIDSIEPIGTQAKMTLRVNRRHLAFPPTPRR